MTRAGERLISAAVAERDRLTYSMLLDPVVVDMATRTIETGDEALPIVWWGDSDGDPCPFELATHLSAGPDSDGLYVHVSLALIGRLAQ